MSEYSALVSHREPRLKNVFGFVDGLWLPILQPGDQYLQNAYYNGWKACCNISNVIVWAPDGTIIWARYNCPGSYHDVTVAAPLFNILQDESRTPIHMQLLGDAGFAKSDRVCRA